MRYPSWIPVANRAALFAGLVLVPLGSHAAQLAYEGFDYPDGASNLTSMDGGSGWSGGWQTVNNGSADVILSSLAAGAASPAGYGALSTGNSCLLPNQRRVGRFLDTSSNGPFGARGYRNGNGHIGADGTTLYLSFMQQANGTSAYYEFEFHRNNLGDGGRIGGIGNDQGGDNVNLRAPNGTHTFIGAGNTTVNFYVVRIDFKPGNDDVYVYRNPTSATDPGLGAATLAKPGAADMSFNGISFGAFNNGRTVAHDEVRFGQSWSDVTLPVLAAPVFASQPQAAVTGFTGGTIGLTAVANGYPEPSYQWYKGSDPLPGQTSSTLTLTGLQAGDAGAYHLVATNSQGSDQSADATVVVAATPAGLLAYEGFDYDAGTSNMNGKSGGLGWGAAWTAVDNGGGNVQAGNLTAGTNAPNGYDTESMANSSFIPNAKRDGRLLDTSPGGRFGTAGYIDGNGNIGADGKTIYISFLQQPDGTSLFYEFEFHRGSLGDPGRIGGIGNDTNNPTVGLRTGGATTYIGPGSTGVNFYVVRIDFKAGDDDVYVYQNPVSATEPGVPTLAKLAASDMSFNGLSVAAFVGTRTVKHDEIRLGESWSDVVFGTSRRELTWNGDSVSNVWDLAASNWDDGASATQFADGDPVTFDDFGSDSPAVNVTTDVATASMTVINGSIDYTIGGTGTVTSSGGLTKNEAGSLTFTAPASFGSTITVNGGSLSLNGTSTTSGNLVLGGASGDLALGGTNTINGSLLDTGFGNRTFSGDSTLAGLTSTDGVFSFTGTTSFTGDGSVIWLGNTAGTTDVTIEPGAVINITGDYADALVLGRDGGSGTITQNGGTVTYNPSNRDSAYLGASGNVAGTTASYNMAGGILDMSNMRLGIALGGELAGVTASLNQTGGSISVRQLDIGSILAFGTGTYNLEGGTMTIGTGGIQSTNFLYTVNLGGGTLAAAADWSTLVNMQLTGTGGDTTIDTDTHTVTLNGSLDGSAGLIKTGDGTLVIGGFNSFSGPTQVNAGTLAGLGNSDFSALTVAAGAAVAPGIGGIGDFFCGSALLNAGAILDIEIDSTNDIADSFVSFGPIDISGATLSLTEIGAGIIPAGTGLTLIDYSGTTLTGTFAGLPQGATVNAGLNSFTLDYSQGSRVTLTSTTVATAYESWAADNGLDGSPGKDPAFDADPENDGVANGLEWILGGNPLGQDGASLVQAQGDAATGITLTFTRDEASLGSVDLSVEYGGDLENWGSAPVEQFSGSYADGIDITIDDFAAPDDVTVTIPASNAIDGRLFARLKAVEVE
ncbi:beta strand repeat-containing protein [Luteolibacter marinus]|uniref:beta strand repeat-containing protein n=1 Tax=Luteolibacter marinus TaxID=2776705 RepID=UPI001866B445|nr:autotransporter-associated beta strand repeat-containing protein [Luteolibacter marinus]